MTPPRDRKPKLQPAGQPAAKSKPHPRGVAEDVAGFLAGLQHPREREILALRRAILAADPSIQEGIKWNSVSFRTSEWFATVHLRARQGVQLILHSGARKRPGAPSPKIIPDPAGLLEWLADDRATVKLRDLADLEAKRPALTALLKSWIERV